MRKLTHSFPAKVAAVVLLLVMCASAVLSAGCTYYFAKDGYYDWSATDGPVKTSYLESEFPHSAVYNHSHEAFERYFFTRLLVEEGRAEGYPVAVFPTPSPIPQGNAAATLPPVQTPVATGSGSGAVWATPSPMQTSAAATLTPMQTSAAATPEPTPPPATVPVPNSMTGTSAWMSSEAYNRRLDPTLTNYRYMLYDAAGNWIEGNVTEDEPATMVLTSRFSYNDSGEYQVDSYVVNAMPVNDVFAAQNRIFSSFYALRGALPYFAAGAALAAVLLTVFLLCAAGRHADSPEPRRGWFDKIPFDLVCALSLGAGALMVSVVQNAGYSDFLFALLTLGLVGAAALLIALAVLMTLAVRIKTHTFLRNNVCVQAVLLVYRIVRWFVRGIGKLIVSLPLVWKGLAFCVGVFFLEVLLLWNARESGTAFFLCALFNLALLALVVWVLSQLTRLRRGAEALASGRMEQRVDETGMLPVLKKHAENLNAVGLGMSRAVEARMKSERMKTDLITNVSHDLKTPLTSIVSYVDLLKKEELHNETAAGYVEVLDRQAQKLKKLTEDLVEASKASSGTVNVNFAPTSVTELLNQSLAEYAERLAGVPLAVVTSLPEAPLTVLADGRLLWRVFDNLLNNAAKYALPGTRLYCTAEAADGRVTVTLKNVSREALNVSPEELMERFVRGDASRATEGSGLGLSIARSLVELQHGTFRLRIDGDLFAAEVTLPAA